MTSPLERDAALLLRQACDELRRRLRSGESCLAEDFLAAHPELDSRPDFAVALIRAEWSARRERGESPTAAEWLRRFPRWAERLREENYLGETATVADPAPHPPAPEDVAELGPHELGPEVGRGAMGIVYRARDLVLNRDVALKVLPGSSLRGEGELARFYREARLAAQLRHPHIVPVYSMGVQNGLHCFSMALAPGGNLAQNLGRYADDPRVSVTLVEKVARAVGAAHALHIVHRDLKPSNILIDDAGEPMVADFGLAKKLDLDATLTEKGALLGTLPYMSPEQATGLGAEARPPTDVWALGVLLYELLTGRRPFRQEQGESLTGRILHLDPPRPGRLRKGIDARLDAVVLRCLEKNPARRYADAGILADDLAHWLRGEKVSARLPTWGLRAGRWLRRRPLVSAAVLVSVLLFAAAPLTQPRPDPDAPLRQLNASLALGEAVRLIDSTGPPVVSHWVGPTAVSFPLPEASGAFTISHPSLTFLELLPDPGTRPFRFRTAARFLANASHQGRVGIYCGYHTPAGEYRGVRHLLWEISFCDRASAREPPGCAFQFRFCGDLRGNVRPNWTFGPARLVLPAPVPPDEFAWHTLALEASGERVCAFVDGKAAGQMTPAEFAQYLQPQFADEQPPPGWLPDYRTRGGLGLVLYNASAAFRDAVVEPMKK